MKKNSFIILAICLALQVHSALAQNGGGQRRRQQGQGNQQGGQGANAPAPAPDMSNSDQSQPVPSNNATDLDSSTSQALNTFMNTKPKEGTAGAETAKLLGIFEDKLTAMDVLKTPGLDNPETRARFETYLSLPEVPQARIDDYFGKMKQVSAMCKAGDTFNAWKMLYTLSSYDDLDAGISKELAARVENYWNTDRTKNGLEMANTQLKGDVQTAIHNADLDAQDLKEQEQLDITKQGQAAQAGRGGRGGGNNNNANNNNNNTASNSTNSGTGSGSGSQSSADPTNPDIDPAAAEAAVMPTMGGALQGKMELTGEYLNLLEARFKIKLNEIKENKMSDEDRMDFADYIKTLYSDHRFYHVIIAADFYRALFNEGDYPSDLSNAAVAGAGGNARTGAEQARLGIKALGLNANGPASMLNQFGAMAGGNTLGSTPDSGQPLTIADQVTSALDINERVGQAIEVFKYKADQGAISAASSELQQAFIGNEYHPGLQGLPRDEKEKVGTYLDKLDVLKHQLEVRAFEQVDAQVADIKKVASDFDSTEPLALVNDIKLESGMKLGQAQLQYQANDLAGAEDTFQTAAALWPGNPDLITSSKLFFKVNNEGNEATTDFDRLVKDENYRDIFDRQVEFAVAVKDDETRKQQLKDALEKVGKAKMAEEKANMLVMNGDVDGAWETVELATKDWPDDVKLNKILADLTGRSADFVSAINKAQDAEDKKEYGYSLTWYVNAQSTYPPSQIANEGIDRVSKEILTPPASASDADTN